MDLPLGAGRHQPHRLVEHMDPGVGQHLRQRQRVGTVRIGRTHAMDQHAHRGLGRAVVVVDHGVRCQAPDALDQRARRGFAAEHHGARQPRRPGVQQRLQVGRHDLDGVDAATVDEAGEGVRVPRVGVLGDDQAGAVEQRAEQRRVAQVGHHRAGQRPAAAGRQVHRRRAADDVVEQLAMLDGDALGLAGRARGVEHIGQIGQSRDAWRHVGVEGAQVEDRLTCGAQAFSAEDRRAAVGRHVDRIHAAERCGMQHQRGPRVGEERLPTGFRPVGFQRHIRRASAPRRQDRDDQVGAAWQVQRHERARRHAQRAHRAGEPVGPLVERPVVQRLTLRLHGGRLWRQRGPLGDMLRDRERAHIASLAAPGQECRPLRLADGIQRVHGRLGAVERRAEQRGELAQQPLDGRA